MEPRGKASRGRQRVVVNTETHTGSSASGVLNSKQALIPQLPPPPLSQTSRKRWQKDCKSQRLGRNAMKQSILDMTWLRHPCTYSNCGEMHKSLTRSSQSIFQHGEGGTQSLTPSWRAIGSRLLLKEGNSFIFKGMVLVVAHVSVDGTTSVHI